MLSAARALATALPSAAGTSGAAAAATSVLSRGWASEAGVETSQVSKEAWPHYAFRVSRKYKNREKRKRVQFRHHGTTIGRHAAQPLSGLNMPLVRHGADVSAPAMVSKPPTPPVVDPLEGVADYKPEDSVVDAEVLTMKLGFQKDVQYRLPDEVKAIILEPTVMCLYGTDKNQVTQLAATLRAIKPPDPYKGAGVRLLGEEIKLRQRKK